MLVISRKKNESIVINDDITIVVVEIRGDKVRLGVEAPKEVPVHRNEVFEAIRRCMPDRYRAPEDRVDNEARHPVDEPCSQPAATSVLEVPPAPRDGLCCPQCQSDNVRVERIKAAYRGAELVRWRECSACGNRFNSVEKVQEL